MRISHLYICLLTIWLISPLHAAPVPETEKGVPPTKEELARAERRVQEVLALKKGEGALVKPITHPALVSVFPKLLFVSVLYRQHPVSQKPPEGFGIANLVVVPRQGDRPLQILYEAKALEAFYRGQVGLAETPDRSKELGRAWLLLSSVLWEDGFFRLALDENSLKVQDDKEEKFVSGKVDAKLGGKGELQAKLVFNKTGRLLKIEEISTLKPDKRPF